MLSFRLFSIQVKDTVEVDRNVSRHLSVELSTNDWNLMVCFSLDVNLLQ